MLKRLIPLLVLVPVILNAADVPKPTLDWKAPGPEGKEFAAGKSDEVGAAVSSGALDSWTLEVRMKYSGFVTELCGIDDCTNRPAQCPKNGRVVSVGNNEIALRLDGSTTMTTLLVGDKKIASSVLFKPNAWHTMIFTRCAGKPQVSAYLDGKFMKSKTTSAENLKLSSTKAVVGDLDGVLKGLSLGTVKLSAGCFNPGENARQ